MLDRRIPETFSSLKLDRDWDEHPEKSQEEAETVSPPTPHPVGRLIGIANAFITLVVMHNSLSSIRQQLCIYSQYYFRHCGCKTSDNTFLKYGLLWQALSRMWTNRNSHILLVGVYISTASWRMITKW